MAIDRTLTFKVRTNAWGAQALFKCLGRWIDDTATCRYVDMYEQRVDGVPMEPDNDNTKELSTEDSLSSGRRR